MKKLKSVDGEDLTRVSNWITIQRNYRPNKRNSLWDYVCDDAGYHPYQSKFNPENGLFLDYFRYRGRTYAVDQFYLLGSFFVSTPPIEYIEHGESHFIGTVDMDGNIFHPLYGEWDEYGERIRLYEIG